MYVCIHGLCIYECMFVCVHVMHVGRQFRYVVQFDVMCCLYVCHVYVNVVQCNVMQISVTRWGVVWCGLMWCNVIFAYVYRMYYVYVMGVM